ncbi:MAG: dUTP diphosphatase, partial [Cetobacterium sp.]
MINFLQMQHMQEELDKKINGARDREISDIESSAIAEITEFNESLPTTHKTWKESINKNTGEPHTREEQLEEYVDVIFFILQLANEYDEILDYSDFKTGREKTDCLPNFNAKLIKLIENIIKGDFDLMLMWLGRIADDLGYTDEEIEK